MKKSYGHEFECESTANDARFLILDEWNEQGAEDMR